MIQLTTLGCVECAWCHRRVRDVGREFSVFADGVVAEEPDAAGIVVVTQILPPFSVACYECRDGMSEARRKRDDEAARLRAEAIRARPARPAPGDTLITLREGSKPIVDNVDKSVDNN
jgi:hypothetical protein